MPPTLDARHGTPKLHASHSTTPNASARAGSRRKCVEPNSSSKRRRPSVVRLSMKPSGSTNPGTSNPSGGLEPSIVSFVVDAARVQAFGDLDGDVAALAQPADADVQQVAAVRRPRVDQAVHQLGRAVDVDVRAERDDLHLGRVGAVVVERAAARPRWT